MLAVCLPVVCQTGFMLQAAWTRLVRPGMLPPARLTPQASPATQIAAVDFRRGVLWSCGVSCGACLTWPSTYLGPQVLRYKCCTAQV